MERKKEGKQFLIIIGVAILIGILVLIFYPDYTIGKNLESNGDYYADYSVRHE